MTHPIKRPRRKPERLTVSRVDRYLRDGVEGYHPDTEPGLSLRIRDVNKGSWFFSYSVNGKQRRMQLAPAAEKDADGLNTARELARLHTANIAKRKADTQAALAAGESPPPPYDPISTKWMQDNAPADITLRDGLARYAAEEIGEMPRGLDAAGRERWTRNTRSRKYLLHLIPPAEWMETPLSQLSALTPRILRDRQDRMRADGIGSTSVNRATSYLITAMNWMVRENLGLQSNPFAGFSVPKQHREQSRSVIPTPDELRALWAVTESGALPRDYARIWRMCALTGARRSEIAGLRVDQVFNDEVTEHGHLTGRGILIQGAKTEAGNRPLPLSNMADKIVTDAINDLPASGQYVFGTGGGGHRPFANWSRAMKKHRDLAALPSERTITIHDLRRLAFTRLAAAGVELLVIQTLIGHRRGSATMLTYNRATYWEEIRKALDLLESSLLRDLQE